jgi:hypothetical protein
MITPAFFSKFTPLSLPWLLVVSILLLLLLGAAVGTILITLPDW